MLALPAFAAPMPYLLLHREGCPNLEAARRHHAPAGAPDGTTAQSLGDGGFGRSVARFVRHLAGRGRPARIVLVLDDFDARGLGAFKAVLRVAGGLLRVPVEEFHPAGGARPLPLSGLWADLRHALRRRLAGARERLTAAPARRVLPWWLARLPIAPAERAFLDLGSRLLGLDGESVLYHADNFWHYRDAFEQAAARGVKGAQVLELGPGPVLVTGVLFVCSGAEGYVAADPADHAVQPAGPYRTLRALLDLASRTAMFRHDAGAPARFDALVRFEGERVRFGPALESVRLADPGVLPFADARFDFVFSNAVLEHVFAPARLLAENLRVLKPGGIAIHQVDLRDHRDFSRPFEFLGERDFAPAADVYTNRLRAPAYRAIVAGLGFEVLAEQATRAPLPPGLRERLDPAFAGYADDELAVVGLRLVLRKPA